MLNKIKLSEKRSKILSEKPETGMGFQDVVVTLKNGTTVDGFVINGQILETLSTIEEADIGDITVKSK